MTKPPRELIEFLYGHDPVVQSLALGLRTVVLDELAPCHEYIFQMGSRVVLLYGPTDRVIKDGICLVAVYRRHVNLGFMHGAELTDKRGVLQGSGKAMRHLSVKKLSELDRPEIRSLLRQARMRAGLARSRRTRSKESPRPGGTTQTKPAAQGVVTKVKVKSPHANRASSADGP
jgi:hypothetical protein